MSAHTPGPWSAQSYGRHPHVVFGATNRMPIAVVRSDGHCGSKIANARLITAAPELLEALKLCLAQIEPSMTAREFEAVDAARAAIAKAEGAA